MEKPRVETLPPQSVGSELLLFAWLAGPAVCVQLLFALQWSITATFVGSNFGTDALTGYSLANLSGNLSGLSIVIGFLSASETLTPQAFSLGNYKEVGQICVRSFLLCMVLLVPLFPMWQQLDAVLIWLKQPVQSALLAKRFLLTYAFAYPAIVFNECTIRFYRAQNVVIPFIFVNAIGSGLHWMWLHLFCIVADLGFDGAPLAHVATAYSIAILMICIFSIWPQHHPGTLPAEISLGYIRETMTNWQAISTLLRLGLPGIFSMSEWWFWEVVCFLSGRFGSISLAAHTVAYTIVPISFMIPLGFSIGLATRIGALLAMKKVDLAKRVAFYAEFACMACVGLNCLIVATFRDHIVRLFTKDPEAIELCGKIWPYVTVFLAFDAGLGVQSGLIRALSQQFIMSWSVFFTLWVFGLPFMYFLAEHRNMGLLGIWAAMPITYTFLDSALLIAVVTKDWDKYAESIETQFESSPTVEMGNHTRRVAKAKQSDVVYEDIPQEDV